MKGFSLVEVLVASAILGVVILAMYMVLLGGEKAYYNDVGMLELQQHARLAMAKIIRELRSASAVTISSDGSAITFDTPSLSGAQFYRDDSNDTLILSRSSGQERAIASYIDSLQFCCWHSDSQTCDTSCSGSSLVEAGLLAAGRFRGRDLSFPLKNRVSIRNE